MIKLHFSPLPSFLYDELDGNVNTTGRLTIASEKKNVISFIQSRFNDVYTPHHAETNNFVIDTIKSCFTSEVIVQKQETVCASVAQSESAIDLRFTSHDESKQVVQSIEARSNNGFGEAIRYYVVTDEKENKRIRLSIINDHYGLGYQVLDSENVPCLDTIIPSTQDVVPMINTSDAIKEGMEKSAYRSLRSVKTEVMREARFAYIKSEFLDRLETLSETKLAILLDIIRATKNVEVLNDLRFTVECKKPGVDGDLSKRYCQVGDVIDQTINMLKVKRILTSFQYLAQNDLDELDREMLGDLCSSIQELPVQSLLEAQHYLIKNPIKGMNYQTIAVVIEQSLVNQGYDDDNEEGENAYEIDSGVIFEESVEYD